MHITVKLVAAFAAVSFSASAVAQDTKPVPVVGLLELSGPGASVGTNMRDAAMLAFKEINAAGGILGRKVDFAVFDTQTNPSIARALVQKAIDQEAYAVIGPIYSGSMVVSMHATRQAEIPNFTGAAAAAITQQGNPYVFRTNFTQAASMPKVARYIKEKLNAKTVDLIWVNNDFGKGGRDQFLKAMEPLGMKLGADVSSDPNQVDFSSAVLKVKQARSDVLFAYVHEEESARLMRELRKQGYDRPIVGDTTLVNQKAIELAGPAANGVLGHVSLTADAPLPLMQTFSEKFQKEYRYKPDHNGIQGYMTAYTIKAVTEKIGKFDRKAFAAAMKGISLSTKEHPGILLDVQYDDNGDPDRQSFLVTVKDGKQVVTETLPRSR